MFAYRTRISGGASKQPDAVIARIAENLLSRNMMLMMQCSFLLISKNVTIWIMTVSCVIFTNLNAHKKHEMFFHNNNIRWVMRPPHNKNDFIHTGKFKKALNMNYTLNITNSNNWINQWFTWILIYIFGLFNQSVF